MVVPVLEAPTSFSAIQVAYETSRIVHVRNAAPVKRTARWRSVVRRLRDVGTAHNVENEGYWSFIVPAALLPCVALRISDPPPLGDHAWIFAGDKQVDGRPEHTDDLPPSILGTWHVQVCGAKEWFVRQRGEVNRVLCDAGDLLLIDTRLWRHRTRLPANSFSMSVARDLTTAETSMTNVDATLAARAMKPGTVVLTEDDLPDCALPRDSKRPNCKVAVRRGRLALVAIAHIAPGDPLTVEDSDDD